MMRRIYKILFCIALAGFQGCSFLEVEKFGKSDIETFFSDVDGLRSGLAGSYRLLYNFYDGEFSEYPEVAADMLYLSNSEGVSIADQYNYTSDPAQETGAVGYIWRDGLEIIGNVNNILQYAPDLKEKYPGNAAEIELIRAQALYIRALVHLNLCCCYGQHYTYTPDASHWGLPNLSILPSANDPVLRASVYDVYNKRIIPDLEEAIGIFGSTTMDCYHASATACEALLARVYLYMEQWQKASDYATTVIAKVPLTSYENYVNMYVNIETGSEAIFRLNGFRASKDLWKFYDPVSPIARPADTLYTFFDQPDDIRLELLYATKDEVKTKACRKFYVAKDVVEDDKHYDPFVSRVSEMYLIRAEANCYLPGGETTAANDIKALQARALGKQPSEINLVYSSVEDLLKLVEKERIKELCFEGHRLFDITRKKQNMVRESSTNSIVKIKTYPNDWFVLPIPMDEIEANPEIQLNPGVNY